MEKVDGSVASLHEGRRPFDVDWEQFDLNPRVEIVSGLRREGIALERIDSGERRRILFKGNAFELSGTWDDSPGFASILSLEIRNTGPNSVRLARLYLPAENGLRRFLGDIDPRNISFFRNGHQSWSTSRSYRMSEQPFRPRFKFVSLASSNMANLPSNRPGRYASEMYALTTDLSKGESFLVGQCAPFDQFFYIGLAVDSRENGSHYFELTYDFGRKLVSPGETVKLDGILMARGPTAELPGRYFDFLKEQSGLRSFQPEPRGWSSWYYYYNHISPEDILENIGVIRDRKLGLDCIQIDDGWQASVGDWLIPAVSFEGRMAELAKSTRDAGMLPGIWLAPFVASARSRLAREHPDFLLRDSFGRPLRAGFNSFWPGLVYYGLDVTKPEVRDYLREVIGTIVNEWGFGLLKLDFLFGASLRGGIYADPGVSRAQALKLGMRTIREAAGEKTFLIGCGMPLSPAIGAVDAMRVGTDTAAYWYSPVGSILRTGAMSDARNSLRNAIARSPMNRRLWINDPDCLSVRETKTKLSLSERRTVTNTIILSGGLLFFSDRLSELPESGFALMAKVLELAGRCSKGEAVPLDLMEREIPEFYLNTAGFIGVFNFSNQVVDRTVELKTLLVASCRADACAIRDVWSGESLALPDNPVLEIKGLAPHASRLFEIV
jgi:alpha-galactosidase